MLRSEAEAWLGTPFSYGGTSKRGIDCSALVQQVYKDLLDVSIPRTTALQSRVGRSVQLKDVKAGDLVFYKIDARTRHVGIYLGDNEFLHTSERDGVTISSMDDDYWDRRFWMIKRVLDNDEVEVAEGESGVVEKGSRVRW